MLTPLASKWGDIGLMYAMRLKEDPTSGWMDDKQKRDKPRVETLNMALPLVRFSFKKLNLYILKNNMGNIFTSQNFLAFTIHNTTHRYTLRTRFTASTSLEALEQLKIMAACDYP